MILQFGGNDVSNKLPPQKFCENYKSLLISIRKEDPEKRIIVGGLLPREHCELGTYNDLLMNLCDELKVEFINHLDNFILKNGKIVPGLLHKDGVHLTKAGTSILIENINDVLPIQAKRNVVNDDVNTARHRVMGNRGYSKVGGNYRHQNNRNNNSPKTGYGFESEQRRNEPRSGNSRPIHRRPCYNCGESNHSQSFCRYNDRLQCYRCNGLGHKSKTCWNKDLYTDTQGNQYTHRH